MIWWVIGVTSAILLIAKLSRDAGATEVTNE